MFKKFSIILSIILILLSCSQQPDKLSVEKLNIKDDEELAVYLEQAKEQPDNIEIHNAICRYYGIRDYTQKLIDYAIPVYEAAEQTGNMPLMVNIGAYLGQAYRCIGQYDSMIYYFDRIIEPAKALDIKFPQILIYNNLAIYEIKFKIDHNKALEYLLISLELAKEDEDDPNYGIIACNIAAIHYDRNDISGLEYAREAYEIAKATNDQYLLLYSTMNMAQLSCIPEEYDKALGYIEEAVEIVEKNTEDRHQYRVMIYSIYAKILSKVERDEEAEEYYKRALDKFERTDVTYGIITLLGYGELLLEHDRYDEAIDMFIRGIDLAESRTNFESLPDFYRGLSDAYYNTGRLNDAFNYHKQYVVMKDSIFNIEKERELSHLAMQYEKSRHQQEIQEKELQHIKQRRKSSAVILTLFTLLFIISGVYIIARKKNNMYRKLVEKHQEFIRQSKSRPLNTVVPDPKTDHPADPKTSPLTEEKGIELFTKIDRLMTSEHLYRQNDISLIYLAELLNTNRSYISRIINEQTGKSFSNYINSFRIDEAVSILSNINDDTPLKALSDYLGYKSLSSFYRLFQKETGVPPSKYRSEVRKISQKNNS